MDRFDLAELTDRLAQQNEFYLEFLRAPSLSVGLYQLPAGATDPQSPHAEDEVYYVVSGQARLQVGEEDASVGPGSVVFVAAGVEHRFHTITEELTTLVFFAPAEGSQANAEFG